MTIRRLIEVRGIVQGVGYRPFVYGLALRYGLGGFVRNDGNGVTIAAEGDAEAVDAFVAALRSAAPPLARVDSVVDTAQTPLGETGFVIVASDRGSANTLIAPDMATCGDCVHELFDPTDRRYRYPFINCTNCGPRYTIVVDVPYDRPRTTMAPFALCPACQAEYDDPLNRRFHAQPNACPVCGPQLCWQTVGSNEQRFGEAALQAALAALLAGQIVAIKGLGGYHLACDGLNEQAVATLRSRKRREAKPFALMVPDLATANMLCQVSPPEQELLGLQRRPIVLLERRLAMSFPPGLVPGLHTLGLMLPYTPLHHLLLHDFAAATGSTRPVALVLTSGNLSDEPIAFEDQDALERLSSIADGFLFHNRAILTRCDDSVTRVAAGGEQLIRRSRGYAPEPISLALRFPRPVLAVGAHLKNTFCLARDNHAFLSQHIGDLENFETLSAFQRGIDHMQRLFAVQPEVVAYDLHPEYLATKAALALPIATKIGVQHHHAHIASVIAEHNLGGPVIGIAADGTGYGLDGAIWGGEMLLAELNGFTRLGHLAYVPLPGGEQAVRQPWRMAAVYLQQAYGSGFLELELPFVQRIERKRWQVLAQMIERGLNSPATSSIGRLFDAVAALVGVRDEAQYEGQAAIEFEVVAERDAPPYPFAIIPGAPFMLDVRPTIVAIVADISAGASLSRVAGRFHRSIAELLVAACVEARAISGVGSVALSGGVFQNRLLLETTWALLEQRAFRVYTNRRVPPNDGGLSLGQAAVAAAR